METKNSYYFCLLENCLSIFSHRSDHAEHKNQIEKLPSELTAEFEFRKKLGTGSFGVVFEVFDKSDKTIKVVKITKNQSSGQEDVVAELELLKELYHHNLIRYFRSGLCRRNYIFITMEYCECNLKDFIRNNKPLKTKMKDNFFRQLCEGVYYLHNNNDLNQPIVHRDLKPTNILIKGNKLRIADFGESKILKTISTNNKSLTGVRGTLLYLPPEILPLVDREEEGDIPSSPTQDIWSLGIIAHEIYSNGQHPFKLPSPNWRRNVEDGKYAIDSIILQNSPIHQIIKGCLEKNPKKRLKIKEVLELLDSSDKDKDAAEDLKIIQIKNNQLIQENINFKEKEKILMDKILILKKKIKDIKKENNYEIARLTDRENELNSNISCLKAQLVTSKDELMNVIAQFKEENKGLNETIKEQEGKLKDVHKKKNEDWTEKEKEALNKRIQELERLLEDSKQRIREECKRDFELKFEILKTTYKQTLVEEGEKIIKERNRFHEREAQLLEMINYFKQRFEAINEELIKLAANEEEDENSDENNENESEEEEQEVDSQEKDEYGEEQKKDELEDKDEEENEDEVELNNEEEEEIQLLKQKFLTIVYDQKRNYKYLIKILKFNSLKELNSRLQLLFRASEHLFSASEFHKYCDNKGPTITIVRSYNECIFGGYASQSWFSKGGFSEAPGSFLFSLDKETKHEIYQYHAYAIEGNRHWGPIFSDDLYLADSCHANGGYSHLGSTYDVPNFLSGSSQAVYFLNDSNSNWKMTASNTLQKAMSYLVGSTHFQVKDYEVFSLDKII